MKGGGDDHPHSPTLTAMSSSAHTTFARAVRSNARSVVRVGELVEWRDGEEMGPGGVVLREVVVPHSLWSSSTWISADGEAYQRLFDPYHSTWTWHGPKRWAGGGRGGDAAASVMVGASSMAKPMRLERAIALAYVDCPHSAYEMHAAQVFPGPLCASTVGWGLAGTVAHENAPSHAHRLPDARPRPDAEWQPLRYTWFSPADEPAEVFDEAVYGGYTVSQSGWVRSPHTGVATRGVRSPSGRHWVSIVGAGHIWVDEAVLRSFTSSPPFRCRIRHLRGIGTDDVDALEWGERVAGNQRHLALCRSLASGSSASELCAARGVGRGSMWELLKAAVRELPSAELQWTARLVHPLVRDEVSRMAELMLPLSEMKRRIDEAMVASHTWRSIDECDRFGMIQVSFELHLRQQYRARLAARR